MRQVWEQTRRSMGEKILAYVPEGEGKSRILLEAGSSRDKLPWATYKKDQLDYVEPEGAKKEEDIKLPLLQLTKQTYQLKAKIGW